MSRKSQDKLSTNKTGWREAVKDTELKLVFARTRVRELESALAVCKERVASGEPFPCTRNGNQKTQGSQG